MLKSKTLSFYKIFEDNHEEIKAIPENYKLKSNFFKADFDIKDLGKVKAASKKIDTISKIIADEYNNVISGVELLETHNAKFNNGKLPDGFFTYDIKGRIPDFLAKMVPNATNLNPSQLAQFFLDNFFFYYTCHCCAKRYSLKADLDTFIMEPLSIDPFKTCAMPEGISNQKYTFNVKSGKLIFANDFRSLFKENNFSEWSLNKTGQVQTVNTGYGSTLHTQYQMERGVIFICTGNSSPSVQINNDKNSIVIACEEKEGYKLAESICTDLWAVQGLDYDHFLELCKDLDVEDTISELDAFIISVEAGEYEIIDHNKYPSKEEYSHFATINKKSSSD